MSCCCFHIASSACSCSRRPKLSLSCMSVSPSRALCPFAKPLDEPARMLLYPSYPAPCLPFGFSSCPPLVKVPLLYPLVNGLKPCCCCCSCWLCCACCGCGACACCGCWSGATAAGDGKLLYSCC